MYNILVHAVSALCERNARRRRKETVTNEREQQQQQQRRKLAFYGEGEEKTATSDVFNPNKYIINTFANLKSTIHLHTVFVCNVHVEYNVYVFFLHFSNSIWHFEVCHSWCHYSGCCCCCWCYYCCGFLFLINFFNSSNDKKKGGRKKSKKMKNYTMHAYKY